RARRAALRARLRRLPQHRQARGAHGRRPAAARVRAPQGRHARLRPGPSRPRRPSPSARAAGHHPRRHGPLLLPPPGTAGAMAETFGTTCHGAGRVMSRAQAKKAGRGLDLVAELARRGVIVRAQSLAGVAEEMPWAYKDVADVVEVVDRAGLARRVARLKPLVVVKG